MFNGKNRSQRLALVGAFLTLGVAAANAQTDITTTITAVGVMKDSAIVIGIAILLFTIGRKVVKRLV